jgi:3-hydroxybutyryl-CoA dehydrogenase
VKVEQVGVAGAGTMGAGVAQVAALGGLRVRLHDPDGAALVAGMERMRDGLRKGVARDRWSEADAEAAAGRVVEAPVLSDLAGCDAVIEASPEDLGLKRALFAALAEACGPRTILATNTSSLRVGDVAARVPHPERVCGMHFFNPPVLMRLVEVVAAEQSGPHALDAITELARAMGREPVRCTDSPGFVVNRCNRPFTLESLRILDEGGASHAQIDEVMRTDGGYRMGPFELMDLVGIDVNLKVARSFHRQRPLARWEPHPIQERMVAARQLGRKSGRGFYEYEKGSPRAPAPPLAGGATRREILERVVCALANEAAFAAGEGVAAPDEIDMAMRLGLNHPRGPFEWVRELGAQHMVTTLDGLRASHGGAQRYEVAPFLRELAG